MFNATVLRVSLLVLAGAFHRGTWWGPGVQERPVWAVLVGQVRWDPCDGSEPLSLADADVTVDGEPLDSTDELGVFRTELHPGVHTVRVDACAVRTERSVLVTERGLLVDTIVLRRVDRH